MGWFGRGDGLEKLRSEMRDGMGLCGEFRRFICIFWLLREWSVLPLCVSRLWPGLSITRGCGCGFDWVGGAIRST